MHPLTAQEDQPTTSASDSIETIGRETAKGAVWAGVATVAYQGLGLANNAVVARYVLPAEYGTVAMAMVVVSLTGIFVTFGMVPAIISGRIKDPQAIVSSHWLICAAGLVMAAVTCAVSPLVAHLFGNRRVMPLLLAASTLLAINAWRVVPNAVIVAAGRFRVDTLIITIAQTAACATGIVLAVMGGREWAVIGPSLVTAVVGTFLAVLWCPVRLKLAFSWRRVRPYVSEGIHLTTNSITEYIFNTSDQVVVGRMLGAYPLGIYNFGNNLVARTLGMILPMVAHPLMSSLGRAQATLECIDRAAVRAALGISRITLPIAVGGILVAPHLIRTLAGPHWLVATEIVRICFVLGAVQSLLQLATTVWLAMGRSKLVMYWGLTCNVAVLGAFILGALSGSANKVALAYMLYTVFLLSPLCLWCTRRWCQLPLKGLATGLLRILRDVAVMALAVWGVGVLLNRMPLPAPIMLLVETAVGVLSYAACFRLSSAAEMCQFLSALPARIRSTAGRLLLLPATDDSTKLPAAISSAQVDSVSMPNI